MADVSSFISTAQLAEHEKGYDDMTKRSRLIAAMLNRRSRYSYNHTGPECKYQAMVSLTQALGFAKGTTIEYSNTNPNIQFTIPWRGLYAAENMDIWDTAMNQESPYRLINLFEQKANIVMEGLKQDFWQEAFNTGSDSTKPEGLNSFLTHTACASTDRIATPNDTYGGLSTVLASQGGSWSTTTAITTKPNAANANDYPDGRGRPEYDATSPMLVNYATTNWGTGAATWIANAWRVLDQTKTWMSRNLDPEYKPLLAMLSSDMWTGFRQNQEAKTHLLLPHKEASDLGFPETLNMDGMLLQGSEFDQTPATVYVLNLKMMEVRCMLDVLFKWVTGKPANNTIADFFKAADLDIDSMARRMVALFMGNFVYRPKYIAKIADFTS